LGTSTNELPSTTIDPYRLSEQGARLQGELPVKALKRAGDLLVSDEGAISAVLDFGRDEENRRVITGELEARIWVTCQRCLEPMEEHVQSRFELAIVSDDDSARQVPSHYEPVQTGPGGGIKVRELVEDELLLAMAPFPMHPEAECKVGLDALEQAGERVAPAAVEGRKKPFELLEGLLDRKKNDPSRH
jgi:uncharacterized protein